MEFKVTRHSFRLPSRRGSTRTVGLAASALTAALAVALVGYFYLRGRTGVPVAAQAQTAPSEAPPDIRATAPGQTIGASKGMDITLFDKDTKKASRRILAKSSEPLENARYLVQEPQAFIYSGNGVVWHVRGDTGRLYMPNTQMQPEAATIEGNVVIRAFDEPPPGEELNPDAADAAPLVTFNTRTIQYDGTLGEVATDDPFHVVTDRADFAAVGFRVLFNDKQKRMEYGEIKGKGTLRYNTKGEDPLAQKRAKPKPAATSTTTTAAAPGNAAPKHVPIETFYHSVMSGGVTVARGSQVIEADTLESWMHLLDNTLADNAITPAPKRLAGSGESTTAAETPAGASAGSEADPEAHPQAGSQESSMTIAAVETGSPVGSLAHNAPVAAPPSAPAALVAPKSPAAPDEIVIRWEGSMVIRVDEEKPAELARDEVAVRFTTGPDSLCTFHDDAQGARGTASTIDYGATSQVLTMESVRPDGVTLTASGSGHAIASSISIDMGSGVTRIESPGSLRDRSDRYITWSDRAEFQFHIGPEGMTSLVETASASGGVEAVQQGARLRGSDLTAGFLVGHDGSGKARSDIFRLLVRGNAQAADGKGGELSADAMDVTFGGSAPGGKAPPPEMIAAQGNVLGQQNGTSLSAESLHVSLTTDEKNQPQPTSVDAAGGVKFVKVDSRADGRISVITATSEEISADYDAQIVELNGPDSTIGDGTSTVFGSVIRVDGVKLYADVFGQGRFEHHGSAIGTDGTSDALVTWTRHASYDHELGIVESEGNVVASHQPDAYTLQSLRADRAKLILEPLPEGLPVSGDAPARKLLQAYAWGTQGEAPKAAQLEMREYGSPFAAGRERPSRVGYLEGAYIVADDEAGTLSVPGPGRMYFSDRRHVEEKPLSDARQAAADAAKSADPFSGRNSNRGDARFVWRDSMNVDQRLGTITISGKSNLRHVRLADGLPTDIEADTLIGRFKNMKVSEADRADKDLEAEFLGADADGNVWIRSTDNQELVADRVEYDAQAGVVKAMANEGNSVVFFDPARGVPQRAKVLFWDKTNNRVEIREAGTIVVPR